jgi:hypothetical protein
MATSGMPTVAVADRPRTFAEVVAAEDRRSPSRRAARVISNTTPHDVRADPAGAATAQLFRTPGLNTERPPVLQAPQQRRLVDWLVRRSTLGPPSLPGRTQVHDFDLVETISHSRG